MKTELNVWSKDSGWANGQSPGQLKNPNIVILFTSPDVMANTDLPKQIETAYPNSDIVGCTGSGAISGQKVYDKSLVVIAIAFDKAYTKTAKVEVQNTQEAEEAAKTLLNQLPKEDLKHVIILFNLLKFDPGVLIETLAKNLPEGVGLTGGAAGDYETFSKTYVYYKGEISENSVVLIGFYGKDLKINYNCEIGCKPYGPERYITKVDDKMVYELDGQPALSLYKEFLGPYADRLPLISQKYPFAVRFNENDKQVFRTIFGIDETKQSVIISGGLPKGTPTQFVLISIPKLIEGAELAAVESKKIENEPELVFLFSCSGRRLVLHQRVEEELESVNTIFGEKPTVVGFYCYGEVSPYKMKEKCYLQNYSMAITTITESK